MPLHPPRIDAKLHLAALPSLMFKPNRELSVLIDRSTTARQQYQLCGFDSQLSTKSTGKSCGFFLLPAGVSQLLMRYNNYFSLESPQPILPLDVLILELGHL